MADLFAPPTPEELELFAAPTEEELAEPNLMAPPTEEELQESVPQPLKLETGVQATDGAGQPASEEGFFDKVGSAIGRGAQGAIAPSTVTDEDIKETQEGDWTEMIAEMAGALGVDLAATAAATKAGAMFGTLIAPGAGTAAGAA